MEITLNPRTIAQNRRLYWLKGQLNIDDDTLAEMVYEYTNHRTSRTSEMQFIECQQLIGALQTKLKDAKPRQPKAEGVDEGLDRLRKRVMRAIFRYGELQGVDYSMEYVKGIACRAAGTDNFNRISKGALNRIYNEFCKKQRVVEAKACASLQAMSLN